MAVCAQSGRVTKLELLAFLRRHRYVVQASVTPSGAPQAAVVGIAVSDDFELVFDTVETSRKCRNLRHNPRLAFVLGGSGPGATITAQYEGYADEPAGEDRDRIMRLYFAVFPDGRDRLSWPGLTYVRVRPAWIRISDFALQPPGITEYAFDRPGG